MSAEASCSVGFSLKEHLGGRRLGNKVEEKIPQISMALAYQSFIQSKEQSQKETQGRELLHNPNPSLFSPLPLDHRPLLAHLQAPLYFPFNNLSFPKASHMFWLRVSKWWLSFHTQIHSCNGRKETRNKDFFNWFLPVASQLFSS